MIDQDETPDQATATQAEAPAAEPEAAPSAAPAGEPGKPPVITLTLVPFSVAIDAGGLPANVVEETLLRALNFVSREVLVQRLQQGIRDEARSVRAVSAIPPSLLRGVRG